MPTTPHISLSRLLAQDARQCHLPGPAQLRDRHVELVCNTCAALFSRACRADADKRDAQPLATHYAEPARGDAMRCGKVSERAPAALVDGHDRARRRFAKKRDGRSERDLKLEIGTK